MKKKVPKRRGRGTFTYKKQGLYSDEQTNESIASDTPEEIVHDKSDSISETKNCEWHRFVEFYSFHNAIFDLVFCLC